MPTVAYVIMNVIALGLVIALNLVPSFNTPRDTQPGLRLSKAGAIALMVVIVAYLALAIGHDLLLQRYRPRGILGTLPSLIIVVGSVIYGLRHVNWT